MTQIQGDQSGTDRELVLTRRINASVAKVYGAWTEPELLKQWFAPLPWRVANAVLDVRVGGSSLVVMADPQGNEFPNQGIYLEVVENQKIVFTDAFGADWIPSAKAFMTVHLSFEDLGDETTLYTARVFHWNSADRQSHEDMGFYSGWGRCTDQLAALVQTN